MPPDPQPLTFLRAHSLVGQNRPGAGSFSEQSWLERGLDQLEARAATLDTLPLKYIRALIAFTDLRIALLTQQMTLAADTISVAHVRGQLREMENLQNALRWWLDYRKEGTE